MNPNICPRILIAGTASGCGKTTITCAILQLLINRGIKTASFKCGPDYIDPMFHSEIIGTKSSNLDSFFCNPDTLRYLLDRNSTPYEMAVIEGVMGYYDGISLHTAKCSTYEVAEITNTPVILTINCSGMANSTSAVLKGFLEYKKNSRIVGVILNTMTEHTYQAIKTSIESEFEGKIAVCGYLPKLPKDMILESRHLGLVTAGEIANIKQKLQQLADLAQNTIDLDKIIALAQNPTELTYAPFPIVPVQEDTKKIRIAVAYDRAFCFYYSDNLNFLKDLGAEIVFFRPLSDTELPPDVDGIYIGGGYPELYANELAKNTPMLASIQAALSHHTPCIAECGGFLYLSASIDGCEMVHYLEGNSTNQEKLVRFGYVTLTAEKDSMLLKKGETIRGHEFHYYDCTQNGDFFLATKENGKQWECGFANESLYVGFPHLHFYSNPKAAIRFCEKCRQH